MSTDVVYEADRDEYQGQCSNCGWHTWPQPKKAWVADMVRRHRDVCPELGKVQAE